MLDDGKQNIEEPEIELRSEELQEIMGKTPPWILRWGIVVVGVFVILLLIGSAIFKYPDTLSSRLTLTRSMPTAAVIARTSGKIKTLRVEDNQQVKAGELLAVIENPAKTEDIIFLKELLQNNHVGSDSVIPISMLPAQLDLGVLQSTYSSFYLALFEYEQFNDLQYYDQKISIVRDRISQFEDQYKSLLTQKEIVGNQLQINEQQYRRDSLLENKGILSDESLEQSKGQFLQAKLSYESMIGSIHNASMQIVQLREQLLDTQYQYTDKKNQLENQVNNFSSQLMASIQEWELNYVLRSPIDGIITFNNYWSMNQNVVAGESIFHIVTSEDNELVGKALLPIERSGKVREGQRVQIRFDNFPDNEFGIVEGRVSNISLVPSKTGDIDTYVIDIEFPSGLTTTYRKQLPYLPEMQGQADIITEDISLLQRLFMPLRKLVTERF